MEAKAFSYNFTMNELKYYLFNKKYCPECKSKMIKIKQYELVDGSNLSTASTPLYIQGRKDVKHYYYVYKCSNCGKKYTLKELVEKTNGTVEK